ncbi:MAG: hypothetical protein AAF629_20930 [Chloroflexota bacterium]
MLKIKNHRLKKCLGGILLSLLGLGGCQIVTAPIPPPPTSQNIAAVSPIATPAVENTSTNHTPFIDEFDMEQAVNVYRQNYCGTCHILMVAETTGTFGPNQDNVATVAAQRIQDPAYTGTATNVADYLLESLVQPEAYIVPDYTLSRHKMPSFRHLSDEELNLIVKLLLQQTSSDNP